MSEVVVASWSAVPVSIGNLSHKSATISETGWESTKEYAVFSNDSKQADFSQGSEVSGSIFLTVMGTKSFPILAVL